MVQAVVAKGEHYLADILRFVFRPWISGEDQSNVNASRLAILQDSIQTADILRSVL
jgi:hypothetical protein